ncbi:N-acetylmuramoyl-L-alanine amidase [Streptomyces sp. NBC_00859]|uniref:peptidoglycan recognition protein family protein n=1 Tax=Streptomyces sp. NBC_00859 TaxID=2903682 RepID=UPI0038644A37|nr:N-acetylmuramoyl-L-alanine amidase [Streptomyces sp. NBC_00859]
MTASLLSTSIAVACAAALALPMAAPAGAATPGVGSPATPFPGSTQSLRLTPAADRSTDTTSSAVLSRQKVKPFSLVGVVWNDKKAHLDGTVQVRTRPVGSKVWTGWQAVETDNDDHAADPGTAEAASSAVRGSTAPLWVGNSDGVQVRVRSKAPAGSDRAAATPLPKGLRLDLVDPGPDPQPADPTAADPTAADPTAADPTAADPTAADPTAADPTAADPTAADPTAADHATSGPQSGAQPDPTELPALSKEATAAELEKSTGAKASPFVAPQPRIVTRKGWGADESVRESDFLYTKTVKAAFVHHTATGNNYTCAQSPSLLRSMYRYHVKSLGWRDIGYNFVIDKCGTLYEGRAGGVTKPVQGAHTLGFNADSTGVAVLGTFSKSDPPAAVITALSRFTAWKLGLTGADPAGKTTLVSDGGNRYEKGTRVTLNRISGHRDGFATECPGARLYAKLGTIRSEAARIQGR